MLEFVSENWLTILLAMLAVGALFTKPPGDAKRMHKFYRSGIQTGADLANSGQIGEPGDGDEPDERPVIGQAKGQDNGTT